MNRPKTRSNVSGWRTVNKWPLRLPWPMDRIADLNPLPGVGAVILVTGSATGKRINFKVNEKWFIAGWLFNDAWWLN